MICAYLQGRYGGGATVREGRPQRSAAEGDSSPYFLILLCYCAILYKYLYFDILVRHFKINLCFIILSYIIILLGGKIWI